MNKHNNLQQSKSKASSKSIFYQSQSQRCLRTAPKTTKKAGLNKTSKAKANKAKASRSRSNNPANKVQNQPELKPKPIYHTIKSNVQLQSTNLRPSIIFKTGPDWVIFYSIKIIQNLLKNLQKTTTSLPPKHYFNNPLQQIPYKTHHHIIP